jgi:hypothetical protein
MSPRARALVPILGVVTLFCLPLLPEILGTRRLVFRDAQVTHWPWRRVAMGSLARGRVPFINPSASGGEPLLPNPNAVLLYPTLLLEKVLPPASAFNLHYLLHVFWALFGARALARRLGLSEGAAFFSGVAFAFSGILMSFLSAFANSGPSASWLPWCAAASLDAVRADSFHRALRGCAATGCAFGMQLLAGEPAISVLTLLFAAFLALGEILGSDHTARPGAPALLSRILLAGAISAALAAPLLLPLSAIFKLTYRGQHLYSERAFGSAPFAAWRLLELVFPRFNGDPGDLGARAHWQYALHAGDVVYVWCVTFGVIPLLLVLLAALRREFWKGRSLWLAAGAAVSLLFSFGNSLPLFRLLFAFPALRRLRYPIKFYLLTTMCLALLSGFAAERLLSPDAKSGRRERWALLAAALFYAAAFLFAGPGRFAERTIAPALARGGLAPGKHLPAILATLRGDTIFGLIAVAVLALVLLGRRPLRGRTRLLGLTALLLAFPWALPLFVSARERDLERPPALLQALDKAGLVYVRTRSPEASAVSGNASPDLPERFVSMARAQIEELVPETGATFGVRYIFDADPDGSYGYYNRLAAEAASASTPEERSRILRVYGARWYLHDEREPAPLFEPVTGVAVAGRRLNLSELPDALPELRWAGREYRRRSLSGALDLVRSDKFRPDAEVVLPGQANRDASAAVPGKLTVETVEADRASARVEAGGAGHVVFSRTFFPAWKAKLDDRPAPVLVANARDLAVAVPAGTHRVEFSYDRSPFNGGVLLQAAALLTILLVVAGPRILSRGDHAPKIRGIPLRSGS